MADAGERAIRLVSPHAFVRTYALNESTDHVSILQEAEQLAATPAKETFTRSGAEPAVTHQATPSNGGTVRLASDLNLARRYGWIDVNPSSAAFRGLNVLVASTICGGQIDGESYEPTFPVNGATDLERLAMAFSDVGLQYEIERVGRSGRTSGVSPREHGSVLGRVLVTLDAPLGDSTAAPSSVPSYLDTVPAIHRLAFARTVVEYLGESTSDGVRLDLQVSLSSSLPEELARLLEEFTSAPVEAQRDGIVIAGDPTLSLPSA